MELGPIFIIGFMAALVSDVPDRHFRRIIPNAEYPAWYVHLDVYSKRVLDMIKE